MFFCLHKWQLGPIDATCQELEYALRITSRVLIFWENYDESTPLPVACIDNRIAKFWKFYGQVVNLIHFMSAGHENMNWNAHNFIKTNSLTPVCLAWVVALDQTRHLYPFAALVRTNKWIGISEYYPATLSENKTRRTSVTIIFLKSLVCCLFL